MGANEEKRCCVNVDHEISLANINATVVSWEGRVRGQETVSYQSYSYSYSKVLREGRKSMGVWELWIRDLNLQPWDEEEKLNRQYPDY